jgi:hypothetical protein
MIYSPDGVFDVEYDDGSIREEGSIMKTMRSSFNLPYLLVAGFLFAGCYTQMETMNDEESGGRDKGDYAYTDTTDTSSDTTNNNYFSDDGYRSSRYRMSFDYYCPPPYLWGTNIWFDPWYDDYGYPWYGSGLWYPTLVYPYPYWYGRYPYYGRDYAYWPYYNSGYRGGGGGTILAGRLRTTGSTRGGDGFMRTRGTAGAPAPIPIASGVASSRTRTPVVPEAAAPNTSRTRSREEVPWWEKTKKTTQDSPQRNRVTQRAQTAAENVPSYDRKRNANNPSTKSSVNQRQVMQHNGRMQPASARRAGPQPRQGSHQGTPRYSSPQRASVRSGSSGGGSRSGGGGSRSGGGGSRSGGAGSRGK